MPNLVRIVIQLPLNLKTQLDNLKQQGYTTSGFIRACWNGNSPRWMRSLSRPFQLENE